MEREEVAFFCQSEQLGNRVIPSVGDNAANEANIAAIDALVGTNKYPYIVAWGKWLGFTPSTVRTTIEQAEADNPPVDAIQKIDSKWLRMNDISNDTNRKRVEDLANQSSLSCGFSETGRKQNRPSNQF